MYPVHKILTKGVKQTPAGNMAWTVLGAIDIMISDFLSICTGVFLVISLSFLTSYSDEFNSAEYPQPTFSSGVKYLLDSHQYLGGFCSFWATVISLQAPYRCCVNKHKTDSPQK